MVLCLVRGLRDKDHFVDATEMVSLCNCYVTKPLIDLL